MTLIPRAPLFAVLTLLTGCTSTPRLAGDTDPWSLPVAAREGPVEFFAEADLDADPPEILVAGARLVDGAAGRIEQIELEVRAGSERLSTRTGSGVGSSYVLFGWWILRTDARPLRMHGRITLTSGEVAEAEWPLR